MALKKQIGEIFSEIASTKGPNAKATRTARIELLRQNDTVTLRVLLKQALDERLSYALPDGTPPYKPLVVPVGYGYTDLYHETRRLHYFLKPECGGHATLLPRKREQLFIQLLEGLQHLDAAVLLAVKEKNLKSFSLDSKLVDEAFPGLIEAPVPNRPVSGLPE